MIDYPSDLSAAQRAGIEFALLDAEQRLTKTRAPHSAEVLAVARLLDRFAVELACNVVSMTVTFLCETAREHHWGADNLRSWTDLLRVDITQHFYRLHDVNTGAARDLAFADFEAEVQRTLRASSPWADYQTTMRALSLAALNSPDATVDPAREVASTRVKVPEFPRLAAWLAREMQLADNLTPHRLEDYGGPDGKTTKKILNGFGARDDVRLKVVAALNAAGRPVKLEDMPRD